MSSQISDPKDFAQKIRGALLADFLHTYTPPIIFFIEEKEQKGKIRKSERKEAQRCVAEQFVETVKKQPQQTQDKIFLDICDVSTLIGQRHVEGLEAQAMFEEERYDAEALAECENNEERVLWWYTHHRTVFDSYFEKNDTQNLAGLRECVVEEKYRKNVQTLADKKKLDAFSSRVAKLYENTFRGKKWNISHFMEGEHITLRVYLENLPENKLILSEKNTLARTPTIRPVFSVICIYNHKEGSLGVRAEGGKENVIEIQNIFCTTFLDCTVAETTERKYSIADKGSIEKLDIEPSPSSSIERVYLKAVEYKPEGNRVSARTLRLDVGGRSQQQGTEDMQELIRELGEEKIKHWLPKKFEIKFIFRKSESGKGRRRQFVSVITEKGHNLKGTHEDMEARKFLEEKGFVV